MLPSNMKDSPLSTQKCILVDETMPYDDSKHKPMQLLRLSNHEISQHTLISPGSLILALPEGEQW